MSGGLLLPVGQEIGIEGRIGGAPSILGPVLVVRLELPPLPAMGADKGDGIAVFVIDLGRAVLALRVFLDRKPALLPLAVEDGHGPLFGLPVPDPLAASFRVFSVGVRHGAGP